MGESPARKISFVGPTPPKNGYLAVGEKGQGMPWNLSVPGHRLHNQACGVVLRRAGNSIELFLLGGSIDMDQSRLSVSYL